jgi:hypothetical protein
MSKYELQTKTILDGWINIITGANGKPIQFDTLEEVRNERESFFVDCIEAVSRGDMDDFDPADHRIEKIIEAHDPIES